VITVRGHVVPDRELTWRFSRSSGPGGQSVNTTDSRVELVFHLADTEAFPDKLRDRAMRKLGDRVTVTASEHRSQLRNRQAAEDRLEALLTEAMAPPPKPRRATKPSKAAKERRLSEKKKRGETKRLRGPVE